MQFWAGSCLEQEGPKLGSTRLHISIPVLYVWGDKVAAGERGLLQWWWGPTEEVLGWVPEMDLLRMGSAVVKLC